MKSLAAAMELRIDPLRMVAKALVGEYKIFLIYEKTLEIPSAARRDESLYIMGEPSNCSKGYAGPDAVGFAIVEDGQPSATCWVWYGERYKSRAFWPLQEGEGKIVSLETVPEARGRGLAPKLLEFACAAMAERGFHRLYARIWHSNRSSVRAFEKAGWKHRALVIELFPLGKRVRIICGAKPVSDEKGKTSGRS